MNKEIDGKQLAPFRVKKEGNMSYRAIPMTDDEILERRAYIRQVLRNSKRNNLPNHVLDNIRLTELDNNGYLFEDERGYEFYIRTVTLTKEEGEFRKDRSMIPFEFIGLKGNSFDWNIYKEDVEREKSYVNSFILKFEQFRDKGMGLYIYSSTKGSGKTMLACCILNELAERYAIIPKFINILDLLEMTKATYKGQEPEELKLLYTATVLVIDDIGVQLSKDWIDTVLYRLVNSRYNNRLVTIYTSNIEMNKLKMGDRTVDRIEATTYLVHLPEKAIRSERRAQEKEEILKIIENAP